MTDSNPDDNDQESQYKPVRQFDWHTGQRRKSEFLRETPVRPEKYGMPKPFDRRPAAIRSRPAAVQVAPPRRLINEVRLTRWQKNITQEELARAAGVHRKTIGAIEIGSAVPSVGLALVLAEALDVSVHEIFRLDSEFDVRNTVRWRSGT